MQKRQERHMPDPGDGSDEVVEGSEDKSSAASGVTESSDETETLVGIGKVPRPHRERITVDKGERG